MVAWYVLAVGWHEMCMFDDKRSKEEEREGEREGFGVLHFFYHGALESSRLHQTVGSSHGMTLQVSFRNYVSKSVFIFVVPHSSRDPIVLALGEVFVKQI